MAIELFIALPLLMILFFFMGLNAGYWWGKSKNCTCKDSTGWTDMPCCNICGKQVEGK